MFDHGSETLEICVREIFVTCVALQVSLHLHIFIILYVGKVIFLHMSVHPQVGATPGLWSQDPCLVSGS